MFYSRARVVVNPLQQGSGVNLKMIEALASGRPVVATPAGDPGAAGRRYGRILPSVPRPEAFASGSDSTSLRSEEHPVDQAERAALMEQCFGPATLRPLILALHQMRPAAIR